MRKYLIITLATILITACTPKEKKTVSSSNTNPGEQTEITKEPSQEELNAKLKMEAVQADFVELNIDSPPKGKKVYVDGEVSVLIKGPLDEFTITSKEGDGFGMYKIQLRNTTDVEYNNGDFVRVYGAVNDKDELGFPRIFGTIIEKR